MLKWLINIISFFKERKYMKNNIFRVSTDFALSIYLAFMIPFLILTVICVYNYLTGVMIFKKSDPVYWLLIFVGFIIYPTGASFGQHIGIDKEAVWMRIGFVNCIRILRKSIQECYLVNGIDFERHLIGETLIVKSIDNKCIYVSNRYTKKQREEIAVLLGYTDGLKSLKKKNINSD